MISDPLLYGAFAGIVVVLLAVDLFVVHRNVHEVTIREAAFWSGVWISVALAFGLVLTRFHDGPSDSPVVEYLTGYVIEKSLSIDNVFLFILIFGALAVPKALQHRVLFYGVVGAIVMRTALIFTGSALIGRFEWILVVFGVFLLFAGYKTWTQRSTHPDVQSSPLYRRVRRLIPTTDGYRGQHFVVRENGRWLATPLLIVLVLVEVTDLVFAVDSIPAVVAVTRDPFIVLTSNIFAIMGLRALYFLLAGFADRLRYLKAGLALILGYVGLKLVTEPFEAVPHPSPLASLGVITLVLVVVVVASVRAGPLPEGVPPAGIGPFARSERHEATPPAPPEEPRDTDDNHA